jgi:ribosomal protein S18 acetylase RimI-like enzyme
LASRLATIQVRSLREEDLDWIRGLSVERWPSTRIVTRGRVHYADQLPGLVAVRENRRVGLLTYRIDNDECEVVTLDSLEEGVGLASSLVETIKSTAVTALCRRIWLITTNDNTAALRFYQKRGFALAALYRNALEHSRKLKPEISFIGLDGIPLRDEIELEMLL